MQHNVRLVARLDIKGENLVKSINLEGLRVLGDPSKFALNYYEHGIDEIVLMDCVASLYERDNKSEVVAAISDNVYIPITVGGGIRSIEDVRKILRSGADKIAINTAAVLNPDLISKVAEKFGSQCMVLSIDAKSTGKNTWAVSINNGRDLTSIDVAEWAFKAVEMGAGEILITSIDREGTRTGFDIDLIKLVSSCVDVPIIASGGMGNLEHIYDAVLEGGADAIAIADILHYQRLSVSEIRSAGLSRGLNLRKLNKKNDCNN